MKQNQNKKARNQLASRFVNKKYYNIIPRPFALFLCFKAPALLVPLPPLTSPSSQEWRHEYWNVKLNIKKNNKKIITTNKTIKIIKIININNNNKKALSVFFSNRSEAL